MYTAQRACVPCATPGAASMHVLGAALRRAAPRCAPSLLPRAAATRTLRVAAVAEHLVASSSAPVVRSPDAPLHHRRRLISRAATAADATAADALRLYNTLSRQKEVFTPRADQVRESWRVSSACSLAAAAHVSAGVAGKQGVDVRLRRDGVRLQVLSARPPFARQG